MGGKINERMHLFPKFSAFTNPAFRPTSSFIESCPWLIYMEQKIRAAQPRTGSEGMRRSIEERACELAAYIVENNSTVRAAAARFGVSKSTVHKDITARLPGVNRALYHEVRALLDRNKAERHIRGGLATRRKYKGSE